MSNLAAIKERNRITDIALHLGLQPNVRNGKGQANCPYCEDQGGHLHVYDSSNRFHCFKCKKNGDWIDLWQFVKNQSPQAAIKEIKQLFGVHSASDLPKAEIRNIRPHGRETKETSSPMGQERLTEIYMELLNIGKLTDSGRGYMASRGISDWLTQSFSIGSMDNPREIGNTLASKYELEELIEAGLFDYSKNGKPYFVFFQPAILFPHFNPRGEAITTMSTRNLQGKAKCFKLHNRPSAPYYGYIYEDNKLYVFEGIFDALSYVEMTGNINFLALGGLISQASYDELTSKHPGHQIVLGMDPDKYGMDALNEIKACSYVDWSGLAETLGFPELQKHENGKPWDLNDYLVNRKVKDGNTEY